MSVCVYVCVRNNVEVHEKFSSLKKDKYTNFDKAITMLLLAVISPIFSCCITVKLSRAEASSENRLSERVRE